MSDETQTYLEKMRAKGQTDVQIKKTLAANGWLQGEIDDLFKATDSDVPLPPHKQPIEIADPVPPAPSARTSQPVTVVHRYTTVGLEYIIMFLSLGIGAISLGALLHAWVNQSIGITPGWFAMSAEMSGIAALVTLPIFLILFLRLRSMEQKDPTVHEDASRRRGVQLALIVSFIWGIKSIVTYLYNLIGSDGRSYETYSYLMRNTQTLDSGPYQIAQILHLVITLGIAGTIFAYYWIDEHRHKNAQG